MISLVMLTYRPGGFDYFASSFGGIKPSDDYEVVTVDDWPGRVERGTVPVFLKERGIKLGWYGKSKLKALPTKGGLANALNTALFHVRGDYVVWISDYSQMATNWLDQWDKARSMYPKKTLISGGGIVYHTAKPKAPGDCETWQPDENRTAFPKWPWVPKVWESFFCGIPLAFYEETNGMDERADHCHCWPVNSQIVQAREAGYGLEVIPEICCHCIDHRPWDNAAEPNPVGMEGLWRITHAQSVQMEPAWQKWSPNDFNLIGVRQTMKDRGEL